MTAITEKTTKIAARLYECRDTAKNILGDKYHDRLSAYMDAIKQVAETRKTGALEAALIMAKNTDDGMTTMLIMAAAVEIEEPTQ